MQDIHQSSPYALFMQKIGWIVEENDDVKIFIKKFPLLPAVIKIQRADKLPNLTKLHLLMKKYGARSISFEPSLNFQVQSSRLQLPSQSDGGQAKFKVLSSPYLPTKTIYIDLTASEETIFKRFSAAKQRGVRRAQKAGVIIKESRNSADFIKLKNKTAGVLGFLTTTTLKPLWNVFRSKNASLLIASINEKPEAGILLLFFQETAYYWIAAATEKGKKSFAPTLLVWEALKLAKHKGCSVFDFEGIYDERYLHLNKKWLGFTKFKEGFGGKVIYYPQPWEIR